MKKPEFTFAVLAGSLCVATLFAAAPAMAAGDEAGYLAEIHSNGAILPMGGLMGDAQLIAGGYEACGQIRGGMSPATLADSKRGFNVYFDPDKMIAASQRYLCPDTL
ncbi:DUF732 domain-containing protein [Mycolicibacter arupensis]|uniref:DUF732 domain-containing protein n=1 Tax=Mycolicibacter arupensis TaxID=342002 RepID=A0A0F5MUJ6_9MYCO|nr:DUF732 domain-containing protein [Mycolicibacter arupensis]KKB97697.1 hypothetical protein WR43_17940 [Mycolicibacter arupensis]MCV7277700.1 DUF732 domain-containing protein [Mycolicibacter arupensis]OQZ95407.1 hypothetical protein BST15_14215 [Mycolicibacter arupensis]